MTKVLSPILSAALVLSLGVASLGVAATAQTRTLAAWQREGSLVLAAGSAGARLDFPDGHALPLPLMQGEEITALAALDATASGAAAGPGLSWLAAGSTLVIEEGRARRELRLVAGDRQSVRTLPVPPPSRSGPERFRLGAVPLVEEGRLVGLAWLAGDGSRSFAVWAAPWMGEPASPGGRWGAPELVSPPGPGSQLALVGAVLADGTWLLAWSAFDGEDDEIVSARRRPERRGQAGSWEPPRRVSPDNPVPDITPALFATPDGGALLAWSRYDGDQYRLILARFEGDAWVREAPMGGPATLYPSFSGGDGEIHLGFLAATTTRSWNVFELDGTGRILARAALPAVGSGPGGDEPALVRTAGGEIGLRWQSDGASGEATAVRTLSWVPVGEGEER